MPLNPRRDQSLGLGTIRLIPRSLRRVGGILGKIFGSPRDSDLAPGGASRALAEYISGVNGSSLIWCSCGEILWPVVYVDGDQAEILALGCSQGHGSVRIVAGVLVGDEPTNAPVH
jgi:hypothetical protein